MLAECGLWIRKVVEHLKWGLMGHPKRNMEESGAGSNVDHDYPAQEASEENNVTKWPRNCSCDTLLKNVVAFDPCLKKSA